MTKYMISFEDGTMVVPEEELPAVADAAHAVMREAKAAGVWVFGGGVGYDAGVTVVSTHGVATRAAGMAGKERVGGLTIIEVPTCEEALVWAAKFAAACRCAQDVREFMHDPEV